MVFDEDSSAFVKITSDKQLEYVKNKSILKIVDEKSLSKFNQNAKSLRNKANRLTSSQSTKIIEFNQESPDTLAFLQVKLMSGRGLMLEHSNLYCLISLVGTDLVFKSSMQSQSVTPVWNEIFHIPVQSESQNLLVSLFCCGGDFRFHDTFIGSIEIHASQCFDWTTHDECSKKKKIYEKIVLLFFILFQSTSKNRFK